MNNKPIIIWEKWRDPFGSEDDDIIDNNENEDDLEEDDIIDGMDKSPFKYKTKNIKCKMLITPFGLIPYNENTASDKIFNFWTGHSNFPITQSVSNIIESVDVH